MFFSVLAVVLQQNGTFFFKKEGKYAAIQNAAIKNDRINQVFCSLVLTNMLSSCKALFTPVIRL